MTDVSDEEQVHTQLGLRLINRRHSRYAPLIRCELPQVYAVWDSFVKASGKVLYVRWRK